MGNNEARVGATFFIWGAFTIIAVTAIIRDFQINNAAVMFLAVMMLFATVMATRFVWRSSVTASSWEDDEKSKRRTRVDRMMDSLSDRDVAELRARLLDEADGEQVSLDELMHHRQR